MECTTCSFRGSRKLGCVNCNPSYLRQIAAIHAKTKYCKTDLSGIPSWSERESMLSARKAFKSVSRDKCKNTVKIYKFKEKIGIAKKNLKHKRTQQHAINTGIKKRKRYIETTKTNYINCRSREEDIEYTVWQLLKHRSNHHFIMRQRMEASKWGRFAKQYEMSLAHQMTELEALETQKQIMKECVDSTLKSVRGLEQELSEMTDLNEYYSGLIDEAQAGM